MGCDIHFFTEVYTANDYEGPGNLAEDRNKKLEEFLEGKPLTERWVSGDKWEFTDDEYPYWENDNRIGRNDYLFGLLAGVRSEEEVICYPKGIPDNISSGYNYMLEYWDGDGHSHSYYTLAELLEINWDQYKFDWIEDFLIKIDEMKELHPDPERVRCVFFFDN